MENKYFTPDIEDIRVGYECEINDALGYKTNYEKIIIGFKDKNGAYTNEISDIINMMDDGYGDIKTPYLTKEQIEAEGWKHEWWEKGTHNWSKNGLILTTFDEFYRIKINYRDSKYQLFDGECKDINTFRYICKLLKIK